MSYITVILSKYNNFIRMERSRLSVSSYGSPIKGTNLEKLEEDKKYILKKIHYLFVFYASRASRYAYREINEKSYMELMVDAYEAKGVKLCKNSDTWKKIVTIYHGKGKKITMDYQSFLKTLPQLSQIFSKSDKTQEQLKILLKHLMLVYESKVSGQIEQKYVQFDNTFSHDTIEYIQKLSENLFTIYKIYFPEEITNQSSHFNQPLEQCFDRVILFFKEFEIYPKIISASHLYLIFLEIFASQTENPFTWMDERNRKRDRTSYFGFAKYLELLLRTAIVSISRLREVEDPQWWLSRQKECLKALFEYMENVRTKVKNSRFQHVRFSLILYEEYKNEREKWLQLSIDKQMKPTSNNADFFDLFEKMKL